VKCRRPSVDEPGIVTEPDPRSAPDPLTTLGRNLDAQLAAAQRQLDDVREQLTDSQRLAAIGTIAAVIAHEFNNLLTPMVSYSQFALQTAEAAEPDMALIRKALSKSYQASTKAGRICASMLSLARGEPTPFGPVPAQLLVDEVLNVLARDPQKDGIALRVQVEPGLTIHGDQVQLEQVLLNLLINARQAMLGKGGALTVKAAADGPGVRVQVVDTGPGIPAKLLPKIFEPFFTTKGGTGRGTGLGLSICKDIVEHHGGRIDVRSTVGKGTTFTLHLPGAAAA
jgi:signal transduction histidine kinase